MIYGDNWDKLKTECYQRDNFTCRKCKRKFTEKKLHAHHIIPYHKNGKNILKNLISLCPSCHKVMDNNFIRYGLTRYMRDYILENENEVER